MKRNRIMFVIAIVAILAVLFVACDEGAQPEHTHTYGAWDITTAPTEDAVGSATRACACGDVETVELAKLSDTTVWTVEASQDATHTSKGFKVYKSAYGTVTVTIEKTTGHTYGAWTLTKNPTVDEEGSATRVCACGSVDNVNVPKLSDSSVWTTITSQDPTHESKGFVQYTSVYGTVLVEVAAGQHVYGNWELSKAPTATETGLARKYCACGSYEEETVAVLTDSVWTKQHTDATHAAAGADVYTSVYGTVTVVIPQIEHSFTGEYKDNGDGTHSRKCTGCEAYSDAVAHDFSKKVIDDAHKAKDADCTHAATYYYSCECGAKSTELTFESGSALGHNYSEFKVTKEPTCTETGVAESICENCDETQTNIIAALGHKYTDQYEPIEFEYGEFLDTYYQHAPKCDVCGYVNESDSENHTFDNEHFYVTSGGDVYEVCTKCGFYDSEDPISSLSNWTVKERVEADYNKAGYAIYTDGTRTYRKEFAKLVAPYDGKTYYSFELSINDNGVFAVGDSWSTAQITFNENGVGTGTAYPFRGTTKITMVNAETGEIKWTFSGTDYKGYVDFETGIIIRTKAQVFSDVFIMLPVDSGIKKSDLAGSKLADGMAASYTTLCNLHEYHTFNILINDEGVLFGVKLQDKDGNALTSDQCGSANYVKVSAKDGNVLGAYQKNADGAFVKTDNYEGTYGNAQFGDVVLDGIGGATINGKAGVYSYNEEKEYFELYVGESVENATEYYTFTLADGQITVEKPMTAITYVTAYGADTIGDEYKSVNSNVKFTLPVLANVAEAGVNEFVGWTIEGQEGYVTEYTPTGADVTLTAVWKAPVTITIKDGAAGETITKQVPYGEEIGAYLPTWDIDGNRKFIGWGIDSDGDGKYTEDDEEFDTTTTATKDITLVPMWKEIPAYVGTYHGSELWGKESSSEKKALTIDIDGNITGLIKTGKVTAYDPATQKVTWSDGKKNNTFYFDAEAKIILGIYEDNDIGKDYYFLGQDMPSDGRVVASYGVYAVKVGGTITGYYAQFVEAKTALGDNTIIFTYGNKIYSGVEIKDLNGNTLSVKSSATNSIAKSASVLVYKDGKVIFARAAAEGKATIGDSTNSSIPRELDAYFGTYTCEDQDNLVLDGTGKFKWGEKNGTYAVTDAEAKKFDLYVVDKDGKNAEYYVVTLNGSTYTAEKPMVTVTYTTAITPIEALEATVQVNKNIEFTLPTLTNADNMFRGWLIEGNETLYNGAYKPVANVDFTAKWDTKYVFTAVYNDGTTDNLVKAYGEGDIVDLATPVWAKHRFDGWFTTESFDEGTEWTSGSAITADITVYAKWSDAEAYYNNYTDMELSGTNANGATSSLYSRSMTLSIDADGNYSGTMYPFDGTGKISNYDKATGKMNLGSFYAVLDSSTGIIVASRNDDFSDVFFMTPFETKTSESAFSSSYWNGGKTRVIEYTCDGTTYRVFINGGNVYFNVTFMSALTGGTAVAGADCYKTSTLYVLDSEGNKVESFAYNGTTMVATDGTEGTYMDGDVKYVLNGAGLIGIYNQDGSLVGSGTYTKSEDSSYQYDVILGATSHKLSVDKDTYTVTGFESNYVTITYMDGENIVKTDEGVYKLIEFELWADYKVEGYVFRGWYLDGDATKTLVKKYTATGNATFVAKLDPAVSLTIVYGNGLEDKTVAYGTGDALNMANHQPEYTNGKVFDHWYTLDGETQVTFTDKTISANITVYCAWVEAVKWYGTYVGKDVYGNSESTSYQANLTVSATGVASGSVKGTINANGTAIVEGSSSRFMAYDGDAVIAAYNYTSYIGDEFYFFAKGDAGTQVRQYKHLGQKNHVVVSYIKNGETIYALVWGNKVYDNVTWTSTDGDIAAKDLYNHVSSLTFYSRAGEAIVLD